jgi:hypothetical protein
LAIHLQLLLVLEAHRFLVAEQMQTATMVVTLHLQA